MTVAAALKAATETATITGDELLALGDIGPAELIDGRIIPMNPTQNLHAYIVFEIGRRLGNFNAARRLGWVIGAESGVYTSRQPDTVRAMDIAFVSRRRLPMLERGFLQVAPELVIEIVSPTDHWSDLQAKRAEYFAIGVDVVWVVEPERRSVLVYQDPLAPEALGEGDILRGEGLLAGLEIPLAELFATE